MADEANITAANHSQEIVTISMKLEAFFSIPVNVVAVCIIFTALFANGLSLAAITNKHGKMTSHFRLLVSLTLADMFSALSTLFFITEIIFFSYSDRCRIIVLKAMTSAALNVTLLNLMVMALDHYIAIFRPLHHNNIMSSTHTIVLIALFWLLGIICGFSDFLSPIWDYKYFVKYIDKLGFCELVNRSRYQDEFTVFVLAAVCLTAMFFMYIRIYVKVWRHQRNRPVSTQQKMSRKTLVTTFLILGSFLVCWMPICLMNISLAIIFRDTNAARKISFSTLYFLRGAEKHLVNLMLFNLVLDPLIYAVRIREVQIGYRTLFRRCFCLKKRFPGNQRQPSLGLVSFDDRKRGQDCSSGLLNGQSTCNASMTDTLDL